MGLHPLHRVPATPGVPHLQIQVRGLELEPEGLKATPGAQVIRAGEIAVTDFAAGVDAGSAPKALPREARLKVLRPTLRVQAKREDQTLPILKADSKPQPP